MQPWIMLKCTPRIDRRYWSALLIASMCGTNLGDVVPDIFHLSPAFGLAGFAALFLTAIVIERYSTWRTEVFYWCTILVVRASATNVADFAKEVLRLKYSPIFAAFFFVFVLMVYYRLHSSGRETANDVAVADGMFWWTMLLAGVSGTVFADGLGHAFASVEIGVPASALLATLYLAVMFGMRKHKLRLSIVGYWSTVFGVRWWGTNAGDILAYLTSLKISLMVTFIALVATLRFVRSASLRNCGDAGGRQRSDTDTTRIADKMDDVQAFGDQVISRHGVSSEPMP